MKLKFKGNGIVDGETVFEAGKVYDVTTPGSAQMWIKRGLADEVEDTETKVEELPEAILPLPKKKEEPKKEEIVVPVVEEVKVEEAPVVESPKEEEPEIECPVISQAEIHEEMADLDILGGSEEVDATEVAIESPVVENKKGVKSKKGN